MATSVLPRLVEQVLKARFLSEVMAHEIDLVMWQDELNQREYSALAALLEAITSGAIECESPSLGAIALPKPQSLIPRQ